MHETLDIRKIKAFNRLIGKQTEDIFIESFDTWIDDEFEVFKKPFVGSSYEEFSQIQIQTYLRSWADRIPQFVTLLRLDVKWVCWQGGYPEIEWEDMNLFDLSIFWTDYLEGDMYK